MIASHRPRRFLAACLIAGAFQGCGKPDPDILALPAPSARQDAAPPPSALIAPPAPSRDYVDESLAHPHAVVLGDSIMHYSDELVARRLKEVMDGSLGGDGRASVKGVTKGGQLINGVNGNGWIGRQFDRYVADPDINLIVLQGGVNDIGWFGKTGHSKAREEWISRMMERFGEMVEAAIRNKKALVLVTVSPWKGQTTWNGVGQEETEALNSWMKEQARRRGVFVADTYSELVTSGEGCTLDMGMLKRGYRGVDVQHPNDAGKKAIAEIIARSLGFKVERITPPVTDACR